MSEETNICKFCGELISFAGFGWVHSKTEEPKCERRFTAEPLDRLPDNTDVHSYLQGVLVGRRAAHGQERKSNLYKGPLSGVAKEILARAFETRLDDLKLIERTCESPVEELFALACLFESDLTYNAEETLWHDNNRNIRMGVQRIIGAYRVDFVFNDTLVVEIDGHDFHDRDQEQASADRKRDRDVLRGGYIVVRFTGSDVYNAPLRCASEVTALLSKNIRID